MTEFWNIYYELLIQDRIIFLLWLIIWLFVWLFHVFLGHMQPNEVTKPYFDDDNISSSEDASDLEFIRPGKEWEEETNKEHR